MGEFKGLRFSNGEKTFSHLFYADDALLMGVWSRENIEKVARILRVFHLCSGLKINIHKSHLFGIGVNGGEIEDMAAVLGCRVGNIPFDYLGIRVGANMNKISQWSTAPAKVLEQMDRLRKNFLWSGSNEVKKVHWVSWETVTTTKADGGLGIAKLADVNLALVAKWAWRFTVEKDALWRKVVEAIHGGRGLWCFLPVKRVFTGCWKTIVCWLEACWMQGSGDKVRFWNDIWLGSVNLKTRWPYLYKLEKNKKCFVRDRIRRGNNGWDFCGEWYRSPATVVEISEFQDLGELLKNFSASNTDDKWVWDGGTIEVFSVANCKSLMRIGRDASRPHNMQWEGWVPIKVNMVSWRAEFDRLPTRDALVKRRINIVDVACPLCEAANEEINHLFAGCGYSFGANWIHSLLMTLMIYSSFLGMFMVESGGKKL
ncbi:RNA-directed DNA polymerase, eukaryota, Reverse transcriptase zinc-binding domain protein [Artemisia annua]|uniref:RNA-directed DNA polymerase, eukaryota, Reverse transcriptase zinc-binding domain protein n=1 Tax=Artemisia annua TaxID=35608 RepID=A0A2U1M5V1_ARTAN|nr:RNA-directed DNA polymerase, eukaryota, Reverse transcriptase zinc-binding domain protein [Artemisia annua]